MTAFLDDMGSPPDGMSIDRVDNDGHYSCGKCSECLSFGWKTNCRWATAETQGNNTSVNTLIVVHGKRMTVAQAARAYGLKYTTLLARILRGIDPDTACTREVQRRCVR